MREWLHQSLMVKQKILNVRQLTDFPDLSDYFPPPNRNHEIGLRLYWLPVVLIKGPLCLLAHSAALDLYTSYKDET